ncbi:hypothetical protein OG393_30835 [Streptomyces sp. NBC_01216]|nr:hypothetical protein OG393_30835 [Streptomyces sp. NBC_01216]
MTAEPGSQPTNPADLDADEQAHLDLHEPHTDHRPITTINPGEYL